MFITQYHLNQIGFKKVGKNVLLSDKASIYRPENISIGDNCRIDDFCLLSAGDGGILLGDNVHIGCYSSLIGSESIGIESYTEISGRVSIYSSTNDFSKELFVENKKRINIISGEVYIQRSVVVGSGSVILPNTIIGNFARVGALSLVKGEIGDHEIWGGVPAKKIKDLRIR